MKRILLILVVMTLFIILFAGCRGASEKGAEGIRDYRLGFDQTLRLAVDYGTRKITRDDAHFQAEFRLEKAGDNVTLFLDCSRMGGGLIRGICASFQGDKKLKEDSFSVLYQHSDELSLPGSTDCVLLREIVFVYVIE